MIPYVGCISREDAVLLASLAARADRILEFGSGASTQIFAEYGQGTVDSVETDMLWIVKTRRNLAALGIKGHVTFHDWSCFKPHGKFDLVLIDNADELRQEAALATWPLLSLGGWMCFHDTRRTTPHGVSTTTDVQNACAVVARYSTEVASIVLNQNDSNTTVVTKRRSPLLYVDWMVSEGRTPAQMGLE